MDRLELRIAADHPACGPEARESHATEGAWIDPDELPAGRRPWVYLLGAERDEDADG